MTESTTLGNDSNYHILLAGVDTLVINVRYTDDGLRPVKRELPDELVEQFNGWQERAKHEEESVVTPLCFKGANLMNYPHGAGKGQWRWLLTCPAFNLCVSRGCLNGIIAQVRFSSEFLWSCETDGKQDVGWAVVEVLTFLFEVFGPLLHLQVSEVHLCADILGWDVSSCKWHDTFLSRARRRVDRSADEVIAGSAAVAVISGRRLATLEFGSHGSPLSCVIYNKSLEIRQKSQKKVWFHDLWQRAQLEDGSAVWDDETNVWRVEFRFKREALHELKEDGVFHGIENADNLPERLEALWTYAVGHAGVAADGLPDGWLRYAVPSSDTNMARWPVHPAWFALQSAFSSSEAQVIDTTTGEVTFVPASSIGLLIRERVRQVNIEQLVRQISGCTSTLSAWLGGKEEDLPLEGIEQVPILEKTHDYHFVLHWLHEHMPHYVMAALVARVNPDDPETLWKKYGAKFAGDVRNKRVLYGLQATA